MGARFSTTDIRFELDLPAWALGALNDLPTHLPTVDARMAAVIEFARRNVRERTGDVLRDRALAAFRKFAATRSKVYKPRLGVVPVR
jgi:hypothetical protein